jgi:hypothetical protein
MAFGAVGESLRRATGTGDSAGGSLLLSAGNIERLVAKLSKMRGAALKLGQMLSFQGSSPNVYLSPTFLDASCRFKDASCACQRSVAACAG